MSNKTHGDFGHGDVKKLILSQAVPLTLAQLVQLLYNIVDRIYIGHMPGDEAGTALSGVGICFPLISLISAFVNFVSSGSSPLCSMARGNKDTEKAGSIMTNAFIFLCIISLSVMTVFYVFKKPLLYVLGASDITYPFARDYINIYLAGTLFFAIGTGMNVFINLQGYPRMGMLTTVIGAVINLILDPIFIFVLNMGVKGAAIATVISQAVGAAWVLRFLTGRKHELRIDLHALSIKKEFIKDAAVLGIPGFVMSATNSVVQAVCNATLSVFGGDVYIGIMTIINSIREMFGLPVNGITSGSQPVLSYNYGAQENDRVKKGIKFTAIAGLLYTLVFWVFIMLFPKFFLGIFSSDTSMIELGRQPLMIYFMGFMFMTLQFSGQSTFVALGKAKQAIFFSIFRKIIIVLPLTLILPHVAGLGVLGVFLAEPISNLLGGLASFMCMYLTVYRKL